MERIIKESNSLIIKKAKAYDPHQKPVSEGHSFVEFTVINEKTSLEIIKAAYMNAASCFEEKRNIAKSIGVELLLFIAGTDQIGAAIKALSPKAGEDFLVISNSKKLYGKISSTLKASTFNPKPMSRHKLEKELEKMALSRL